MRYILIAAMLCLIACHGPQVEDNGDFKSARVSKTASFVVDQSIEDVFPLFGAFEERKWAPGWTPILIYPDQEIISEGTTFKIAAHGHGHGGGYGKEDEYLWVVSKYDPASYLIQYHVSTPNRFWTITVQSEDIDEGSKTKTAVTYAYTGLNSIGNELNKSSLDEIFSKNLEDWKELLDNYFASK